MRILLLNNNPVVNKLVTLSAQKTSNTLDTAESVEAVESKKYDILIVDDALYSEDAMEKLRNKIEFSKSLYICSKDAKPAEEFTRTLKKPFLPTD
ncbi:MAG: DNA topoisomerase IV, partial [Campylobacterota bacterium]